MSNTGHCQNDCKTARRNRFKLTVTFSNHLVKNVLKFSIKMSFIGLYKKVWCFTEKLSRLRIFSSSNFQHFDSSFHILQIFSSTVKLHFGRFVSTFDRCSGRTNYRKLPVFAFRMFTCVCISGIGAKRETSVKFVSV